VQYFTFIGITNIFGVSESKKTARMPRILKVQSISNQSVTYPSNTNTAMFYCNMAICFGLHRPSSGHCYKNFQNTVKITLSE